MNVEVLGEDDVALDGFKFKFFKKALGFTPQALAAKAVSRSVKAKNVSLRGYMGEDDFLGAAPPSRARSKPPAKPTVSQALSTAVFTSISSKMTPTAKALLAQAQTAAGIPPSPVSASSQTPVVLPGEEKKGFDLKKNMPLIVIAGAVAVGLFVMMGTKKARTNQAPAASVAPLVNW